MKHSRHRRFLLTLLLLLPFLVSLLSFLILLFDAALPGRIDFLLSSSSSQCHEEEEKEGIRHLDLVNFHGEEPGGRGAANTTSVILHSYHFLIWNVMRGFIWWTGGDYCQFCKYYQGYRCHVRVGEWNTKRFQWWKEFEFKDLSIHANPDCTVLSQTTSSRYSTMDKDTCSRDDDNDKRNKLVFIKNPPPLIESLISMKPVNALYNILPITCTNEQRQEREEKAPRGRRNDSSTSPLPPPPAVQVQSTSLRWDSPSQPIIHANLSGIIFNIRIGSALTPIDFKGMPFWEDLDLTTLEVPMPMIWVGNWTLDDIGMMIPDPPEEEGLYPRIGIVNITNVTISVHHQPNADKDSVNMDSLSLAEIPIPDQVFLPLLQLTIDAGKDGTDQVLISSIIRESILMILRKQILKEDAIRVSFDKTTELVEGFQQILSEMMSRADEVFESHASKTSDKVNDILSKMEEAWKVALEDDSNPMVRITKDVTTAWDDLIKKMLREVGSADEFKLVFKDLEEEMSSAWEDMKKEVSEEWKMAKEEMSSEMDNLVLEAKQNWNILRSRAYDMVHPFTSGIVDLLGNHHGQDQQTQTS